jgi:ATP-dependent exoDNAse (exonuclease V) alpha subunit
MVEHALAGHQTLSDEQQRMVEALTRAGHRIDAVIGVAGSGKTYALSVAHQLWTDSGHRVLGATISKQAANQLQADSGITSGTLDSLLLHLRQADARLAPDTVLVVDEAGMVPTRKLAELLDHCPPDIKVVLVGDHDQLPEIGAGGVLRAFAERHDVATLEQNRRQHDPDERAALAEVRNGDLDAGLDWYVQAGRVATFDDALSAREALIDAWWADHSAGCDQLIMAERRTEVDRLNQLARRRRAREGELDLVAVVAAGGRDFAIGDRVIFERNDQRMGVANAQRGTVTGLDHRTGGVTVDVDGRAVEVDSDYLEASDLNWGYSATVHKN